MYWTKKQNIAAVYKSCKLTAQLIPVLLLRNHLHATDRDQQVVITNAEEGSNEVDICNCVAIKAIVMALLLFICPL
uniref:Uncharacterized protein n=1 Tax=Arion vulgaris TaxID=1028688 RepID=A0A0B6YB86_9EUPU